MGYAVANDTEKVNAMTLRIFSLIALLFGLISLPLQAEEKWQSPLKVAGSETITLAQAKEYFENGTVFIDVRSPRQYAKRHIPGALNLYVKDSLTEQSLATVLDSKDQTFVIYCNGAHCSLSYHAVEKAVGWGYTQAKYFREGARAWRLDGNPLETGNPAQSN